MIPPRRPHHRCPPSAWHLTSPRHRSSDALILEPFSRGNDFLFNTRNLMALPQSQFPRTPEARANLSSCPHKHVNSLENINTANGTKKKKKKEKYPKHFFSAALGFALSHSSAVQKMKIRGAGVGGQKKTINRLPLLYISVFGYVHIYSSHDWGLYMSTQLLARPFRMAGAWSICSVRPGSGGRGSCDTLFRPLRELLRLSCGLSGCRTDANVVMWNTSRTLFSETLEVHST